MDRREKGEEMQYVGRVPLDLRGSEGNLGGPGPLACQDRRAAQVLLGCRGHLACQEQRGTRVCQGSMGCRDAMAHLDQRE